MFTCSISERTQTSPENWYNSGNLVGLLHHSARDARKHFKNLMFCDIYMCCSLPKTDTNTVFNPVLPRRQSDARIDKNRRR
jgi:hypothetical protein